ncbi:hypothetical protein EMGBS8_21200, partial [Verrucomicrobiota bacterium]
LRRSPPRTRRHHHPGGIDRPFTTSRADVERTAAKFLLAVQEAGKVYRYITSVKGVGRFVPEISMDETDSPQTPPELLVILAAIADEGVPIQTIAPKFTGRFNKGVDYVGDLAQFRTRIQRRPLRHRPCGEQYGLPTNLKLSVAQR